MKAVIAESFERIHRSNLVNMGVLPLEFRPGENAASLKITGKERFDVLGMGATLTPRGVVTVRVTCAGRFDPGHHRDRADRYAGRTGRIP